MKTNSGPSGNKFPAMVFDAAGEPVTPKVIEGRQRRRSRLLVSWFTVLSLAKSSTDKSEDDVRQIVLRDTLSV